MRSGLTFARQFKEVRPPHGKHFYTQAKITKRLDLAANKSCSKSRESLNHIRDKLPALRRIDGSTEKMAGMKPGEGADLGDTSDIELPGDATATPSSQVASRPGDGTAAPKPVAARRKELGHA